MKNKYVYEISVYQRKDVHNGRFGELHIPLQRSADSDLSGVPVPERTAQGSDKTAY